MLLIFTTVRVKINSNKRAALHPWKVRSAALKPLGVSMNDFSISREQLESELREYSQTLALVATVKSAPLAAKEAREELPHVLAFIAHLEAMPATPQAASTRAPKVRCAWYREIRRCYAIAREAGLDVKADAKMRASFSRFLGRAIESREELRAGDWYLIASEIKAHRLSW
jgi:DNA-binding Lrp family transcriptional regulator